MLTGNRDTDYEILKKLDDYSLLQFCQTSTQAKNLCNNQQFWLNRLLAKYEDIVPIDIILNSLPEDNNNSGDYVNRNYRNFYLKIIRDINIIFPWKFLNALEWDIRVPPDENTVKYFSTSNKPINNFKNKSIWNQFWYMNLAQEINIEFQIDPYNDNVRPIVRHYQSQDLFAKKDNTFFTPYQILLLIYEFYQEKITDLSSYGLTRVTRRMSELAEKEE